ncbi:MAG: hypothetical protein U1F76_02855 [Candidatus Competibacteraceae bacterium]
MTEIIPGQQPQPADEALIKAYHDAVIKQADLYVDLAKELLKLELAIPGILRRRKVANGWTVCGRQRRCRPLVPTPAW